MVRFGFKLSFWNFEKDIPVENPIYVSPSLVEHISVVQEIMGSSEPPLTWLDFKGGKYMQSAVSVIFKNYFCIRETDFILNLDSLENGI